LRETLFNVLTAGNPGALEGSIWADLYAGTGAIGIEALSRGAGRVYFVEASRSAAQLIRENLDSLQAATGFEITQGHVAKTLRRWEAEGVHFDTVFLDPPFAQQKEYGTTLEFLGQARMLRPTATVIAEHLKKFDPGGEFGELKRYRTLAQGDAALSFYRRS
jgi:16S rRNA (guanine(966)-N(2))-methyltransferase RsmD